MPTTSRTLRLELPYYVFTTNKFGATDRAETTVSGNYTSSRTTGLDWPDWKHRIAVGNNATTSLSGKLYSIKPGYFNYTSVLVKPPFPYLSVLPQGWIKQSGYGFIPVLPSLSVQVVAGFDSLKADNHAKVAFVQRATALRRSIQGGTVLGELAKTIATVKRPAQSLRRGLDDYATSLMKKRPKIRRSPPAKRRQTATEIAADTWLEYAYAWTPLVHDIDDGMKTLANALHGDDKPYTAYVSGKGSNSCSGSNYSGQLGTFGCSDLRSLRTWETEYSVKYYGKVHTYHPGKVNAGRLGLSLEDFVPTVWELIPYSFLADYFTNIGDMIQCASFLRGHVAWVAKTSRQETKEIWRLENRTTQTTNGAYSLALNQREAHYSVKEFQRSTYTGSLVPNFELQVPGSSTKWINMAALGVKFQRMSPFHLL